MPEQATAQVWLVDQQGPLTHDMTGLRDYQKPYARDPGEVTGWATSSATTAVAVARAAAADGVAATTTTTTPDNLVQAVQDAMWQPAYPEREE